MATDDSSPILDPDIQRLIRRKAWKLVGRAGLQLQDRKDLEHELTACALQRLPAYNPQRGPLAAFLSTVLDHAGADLLRYRRAEKRHYRRAHSLQQIASDNDHEITDVRKDPSGKRQEELHDLAIDLAEVLERLPPELREVAEQLKYARPATVARQRGVPPSTLYDAIRRIRQVFEAAGLREYL